MSSELSVLSPYREFIASKLTVAPAAGFRHPRAKLPRKLFAWQKDIVLWAIQLGRVR